MNEEKAKEQGYTVILFLMTVGNLMLIGLLAMLGWRWCFATPFALPEITWVQGMGAKLLVSILSRATYCMDDRLVEERIRDSGKRILGLCIVLLVLFVLKNCM